MTTLCPVALAVGCRKCPVFSVCPLKSVIGDYPKDAPAPAPAATPPLAAKPAPGKPKAAAARNGSARTSGRRSARRKGTKR